MADSYSFWNEDGARWAGWYDARKKWQPYLHIQEILVSEYLRHAAPARVLEYGCGPGRHLRNLVAIPGLEVFGFDQSETMVSGMSRWASPEWVAGHVALGDPVGRLPWPDGHFDLVFTSEVLVHVPPEDLPGRLAELRRVSRREVFHIEPAPGIVVHGDEHRGCWNHDLVEAWGRAGLACEVLPSAYVLQAPYRVVLDPSVPTWSFPEGLLVLLRRIESDLEPLLLRGLADEEASRGLLAQLEEERRRSQQLSDELGAARSAVEAAGRFERLLAELIPPDPAEQAEE